MISVGIVGASGYTGEELTKILLKHPEVKIEALTSNSHVGKKVNDIFNLNQKIEQVFIESNTENLSQCDLVFFATPNGIAMNMVEELVKKNIRVIDISADFRIASQEVWEKWYQMKHLSPSLLDSAVYGLPELPGQKDKIKNAKIVANPGCFPTSSILGLLPICKSLKEQKIILDAKSGISGAGRNLKKSELFSEGQDNFQAYAVECHRHYPEMLQIINMFNSQLDILFVPHLSSMHRGIFSTLYLKMNYSNVDEITKKYKDYYENCEFIKILDSNSFPKISDVEKTNNCHISIHQTSSDNKEQNVVILSVLDNLVKGASGQAVQNMNIMFQFDEKTALT
ncbi:MAG: N-acetyl-gamma-glutamyl-phosphate reductase [Gammaproteobacteria bacterium]|nr:N-acetyl-gamma-glutamyl-phosphate reductase [Gammaproteobacteria bacterium]|tara:strand:- start:5004 stop:6023 length:1020 start_codon:yes stop_codon:yes gene_type:complete